MTKEDLVLVCGDFGGIWHGDPRGDAGLTGEPALSVALSG